jgi:predicted membrane protein
MHSYGSLDYIMLFGVAVITAVTSALLPEKWGWKAFPLAILISTASLMAIVFGVIAILYQGVGGTVVHFNLVHLALAVVIFGLTLGIRRRRQKGR